MAQHESQHPFDGGSGEVVAPDQAGVTAPTGPRRRRWWRWLLGGWLLLAVGTAVYQVATWPDVASLATRSPETTAFIERFRSTRHARGENERVEWQWVSGDRISPHLMRAVVAGEDLEFFTHHGFSTTEMRAALRAALKEGEPLRGASTITQQLAKNLWLTPSRNPWRKVKEALLTRQLEQFLSKRRILEIYVNVVEFGPGIYGAEAAARYYFGKPASSLTQHEAAMLAAGLPRPSSWHPGRDTPGYRHYVAEIERRLARATFLWRYVDGTAPANVPPAESLAAPVTGIPESLLIDTLHLDSLLGDTTSDTLGRQPPDSTRWDR